MPRSATFTPAQKALHDVLTNADTYLLYIARQVIAGAIDSGFGTRSDEPDPEDYGAPLGTPEWDLVEAAAEDFDKATSGMGEKEAALAALDVIDAILNSRGV